MASEKVEICLGKKYVWGTNISSVSRKSEQKIKALKPFEFLEQAFFGTFVINLISLEKLEWRIKFILRQET